MTLVQMKRVHRFKLKTRDGYNYMCFFMNDGSDMVFTLLKLKCHVYRPGWTCHQAMHLLPMIIVVLPLGNSFIV